MTASHQLNVDHFCPSEHLQVLGIVEQMTATGFGSWPKIELCHIKLYLQPGIMVFAIHIE